MKLFKLLIVFVLPIIFIYVCAVQAMNSNANMGLIQASQSAKIDDIGFYLEKGANPDIADEHGITPVIWAALNDQVDALDLLIKKGANLDARNKNGDTALLWAAVLGHDTVIEKLITSGANINITEPTHGATPLMAAAASGQTSTIRLLLQNHADLTIRDKKHKTALDHASLNGRANVISVLLTQAPQFENFKPVGIANTFIYLSPDNEPARIEIFHLATDNSRGDRMTKTALFYELDSTSLFSFAIHYGEALNSNDNHQF